MQKFKKILAFSQKAFHFHFSWFLILPYQKVVKKSLIGDRPRNYTINWVLGFWVAGDKKVRVKFLMCI